MKSPTRDVPGYELPQLDAADMKTIAGQCRDLFEDPSWSAPVMESLLGRRAAYYESGRDGEVCDALLSNKALEPGEA